MTTKGANEQLFKAAIKGNITASQAAIDAGANVNAKDEFQLTALHWATETGHTNVAQLLIDKGADVNARNGEKRTPLHFAAMNGGMDLIRLLIEKGADVNARDFQQQTPLQMALTIRNQDAASFLTDAMQQKSNHAVRRAARIEQRAARDEVRKLRQLREQYQVATAKLTPSENTTVTRYIDTLLSVAGYLQGESQFVKDQEVIKAGRDSERSR